MVGALIGFGAGGVEGAEAAVEAGAEAAADRVQLPDKGEIMPLADGFPLLNAIWLIFVFFAWLMVFGFVIMCLIDNFRRPDISGLGKAAWTIFIIVLPLIGALAYQISRPKDVPYDGAGYIPADEAPNTPTSARDQATHMRTGL